MATSTLKDVFSTTITDYFVNQVATHLSEKLKSEKSVEVSAEEICKFFNVSYTPKPTMTGLPQSANMPTQMPNLPGYFSGTGASPATKSSRGGRRKAPVDPNAPKCVYTFQRGNKKGEVCGEIVANNGAPGSNEYCKSCLKKKTVQNRINNGASGKSSVQPPVVPGGMVSVPDQQPSNSDNNSVNAVPIPGHNDLFKDVDHGFILKQYPDGSVVAISMEENGVQRPLTQDEKNQAQAMGIDIMDSPSTTSSESVPTIPSSSGVPTIPSVPAVSSSTPSAVPAIPTSSEGQGVPTIPTVPNPNQTPVQV
jgi:hypothetical protein